MSPQELQREAERAIAAAKSTAELRELEIKYLGKSGLISGLMREIGGLPPDQRPVFGQKVNEARAGLQALLDVRAEVLKGGERAEQFEKERIDITLPGRRYRVGLEHVLHQTERRIKDVFAGLGFRFFEGPELEEFAYNFTALNYPADHPAFDEHDTFYVGAESGALSAVRGSQLIVEDRMSNVAPESTSHIQHLTSDDGTANAAPEATSDVPHPTSRAAHRTPRTAHPAPQTAHRSPLVLRTHCTAIQGRVFEQYKPPLRFFTVGRCYRNDPVDRTHSHTFHQVDAFMIDEGVSMAHLKGTLRAFAQAMIAEDVKVRFRPDFFPFVEPGVDYAISTPKLFDGRWVELGGAGMIHPAILEHYGIDTERWSGWAFGLGTDRLPMMAYGIDDLRYFTENDVRFLEQFRG